MISSKQEYKYYLQCDQLARWGKVFPWYRLMFSGTMWKYNYYLRKIEYLTNCKKGLMKKIRLIPYKIKFRNLSYRLGWFVAPNSFEEGLCIVHPGTVVVNGKVKAGRFCRIHVDVNIGGNGGENAVPQIGDYVYIAPGAKIFGDIRIADDVAIGANAVVNKSILREHVTVGGIPAKIISEKGTQNMIKRY